MTEGVVIYKDITHKIIMEEYNVLKEKTMDYSLIYGTISYPDLKIMYINEQGYRCIGHFNSNIKNLFCLIDKSLFELCISSEEEKIKLINGIKTSIEKRETSFTFIEKIVKNNESKYFKIIFQPLYDKDNEVNKISIIGMDITKEKTTNEKINNALKSQEEMFVNASHELKTPLNLIFSASQLLDQNLKKNDSIDDNNEINYINKIILRNCYRITKLIDNILDISKLESGFYKLNLTNEHIVDVTEDIIQSVAKHIKEKGFKIVFDTEIEEKIIGLDLYKFERIMLNLISNAIKFSDESGTIFVNLYDKGDFIEITVEDKGIGIAKENLEIIFDKFHQINKSLTRTSEGSGIGLSLVKSLVKLHRGEIIVESTLGKGTKFTIKLPAITVDKQSENISVNNNGSREEMIKFELSDIY